MSAALLCDAEGCEQPAAYVVRFRGQAGHVHDCPLHAAELRQLADVAHIQSMPCPVGCTPGSPSWVDVPRSRPVPPTDTKEG